MPVGSGFKVHEGVKSSCEWCGSQEAKIGERRWCEVAFPVDTREGTAKEVERDVSCKLGNKEMMRCCYGGISFVNINTTNFLQADTHSLTHLSHSLYQIHIFAFIFTGSHLRLCDIMTFLCFIVYRQCRYTS